METKSFKQMIQSGDIKRADAMKVQLEDIHEEPGFNLRMEGADLQASIDALAEYIAAGGMYPALEVRPRANGGVFLVDGHRRRRALVQLDRNGRLPRTTNKTTGELEAWIPVVAFEGNDADRVARIISSAEGRGLSPLEVAMGYKRLAAFNLSPDDIAKRVGKTRQHVDQLLILATANSDVHRLVASGDVSAAVAVNVARKHGENAGKVLGDELAKAKAAGKGKVTAGTMAPKPLPQKVTASLVEELYVFMDELPKNVRIEMAELEKMQAEGVSMDGRKVEVPGSLMLGLAKEFRNVLEARAKLAEKARAKAEKAAQQELAT